MHPMKRTLFLGGLLAAVLAVAAGGASAETLTVVIKDHRFEPAEIEVPAGAPFELLVKNADATPEEFESHDLDLEKVIPGGAEAVLKIDALDPGVYEFVGEFHEDSAKGRIVVK